MNNQNNLTEKEWLEMAWKYFQQHAQQRISYFNFFVIFSTILTTAYVATFQNAYKMLYLGIPLGIIQAFVSIMFIKIDLRNKFLTRNAEDIIINIEKDFDKTTDHRYSIFTTEDLKSKDIKSKKQFFLFKQWSHGKTYVILYIMFGFLGLAMSTFSFFYNVGNNVNPTTTIANKMMIYSPENVIINDTVKNNEKPLKK